MPLAAAVSIHHGRFTLGNDNPNPQMGALVFAGLFASWVHWAALAVFDPVATRNGFQPHAVK
eukprot:COSAG04_NODE_2084_length_4835_cov_1.514780_1_plen_62_part_10